MNIIDFYYFSGTGNTKLVVQKMKSVFEGQGIEVNLKLIEKSDPLGINLNHTIGLGFPVAEQGTYPFVWDFIEVMPKSDGTKVFMVDTLLAFSGGIVGPVRTILKSKGYKTIGAKEILMPSNLFPKKLDHIKMDKKVRSGLLQAEKYALDIINGSSRWGKIPFLSYLMSLPSRKPSSWVLLRRYYKLKVDNSKCTSCGLCVKLCPIDNIVMEEFAVIGDSCTTCMRCFSFCPQGAIKSPKSNSTGYRGVTNILS